LTAISSPTWQRQKLNRNVIITLYTSNVFRSPENRLSFRYRYDHSNIVYCHGPVVHECCSASCDGRTDFAALRRVALTATATTTAESCCIKLRYHTILNRRQWHTTAAAGRRTADATSFMRAAAGPLAATAATTQTHRHRRRRRRRRIFLDPKPLAARARHVCVAVQGNPGEFVQVRPMTAARHV